jgi:hypothetical protein
MVRYVMHQLVLLQFIFIMRIRIKNDQELGEKISLN